MPTSVGSLICSKSKARLLIISLFALLTVSLLEGMRRATDTFTLILTNVEELVGDGNWSNSREVRRVYSQTYAVRKGNRLPKEEERCLRIKTERHIDRIG